MRGGSTLTAMKAVQDFNYKVALASGLRSLQAGRLRQAEEQFRYLVSKFPRADGGYRGLAKVFVELGDRPAAVGTLRDGAAALAKAGERPAAIDLLREAVTLDPLDLAAHRRLAAALALAGDIGGAAQEYVRFSQAEQGAGDPGTARLEATYALETLGELSALAELARSLGIPLRAARRPAATDGEAQRATSARTEGEAVRGAEAPSADEVAAAPAGAPALMHEAPRDPLDLEAEAAALIAGRDVRAGAVAIEAARALVAGGRMHAASDLLLQLVATGIAVHDAEAALVPLAAALGRRDIAKAKCALLAEALRLEGRPDRAAEVERWGQVL